MRTIGFAGLLLAAVTVAVASASPHESRAVGVWLKAGVSIDAQGHVTALDWIAEKPAYALISDRLTPMVKAWQFVPATAGGHPVATQTGLLVHVFADEHDGALRIRFDRAQTGPMAISMQAPRYPAEAAKAGISALVMSQVQVTSDGKPVIDDLKVTSNGSSGSSRNLFEKAARAAIADWTFKPEIVDGRAVASTIRIPISFCMRDGDCRRFESESAEGRPAGAPDNVHIASETAVALKTDIRAQTI